MNDLEDNDGCMVLVLGGFAIAAVIAALISLTALIDPFSWMPPVTEIWADCEGECDLADRFPGFWVHAVINLVWTVAAGGLALVLVNDVWEYREALAQRFDSADALAKCEERRASARKAALWLGIVAALPIVVTLA